MFKRSSRAPRHHIASMLALLVIGLARWQSAAPAFLQPAFAGPLDFLKGQSRQSNTKVDYTALSRAASNDNFVDPINYKMTFDFDLPSSKYSIEGHVKVRVRRRTNKILLTGFEQNLHDVYISDAYAESGSDVKDIHTDDDGTMTLGLVKSLEPGTYTLHYRADNTIRDEQSPFYRSKLTGSGGNLYLARTKIGSRECGLLFPYLGKPRTEATFEISCALPEELSAISNSPVESVESLGDKKLVHFKRTPDISSYMVALIVGPFHSIPEPTFNNTPATFFWLGEGRPPVDNSRLEKLESKYLSFCEEIYPLTKLDIVALPGEPGTSTETLGVAVVADSSGDNSAAASATGSRAQSHEQMSR